MEEASLVCAQDDAEYTVSRLLLSCIEGGAPAEEMSSHLGDESTTREPATSQESSDSPFAPSQAFTQLRSQELRNETPVAPAERPASKEKKASDDGGLAQILGHATLHIENGARCTRPHLDVDDEETMFLLSLRGTLKSLDMKKRRLAHMRIQEVLYKLEFDE